VPRINGKPVNLTPKKVFDSPYLSADHGSGVVTLRKDDRTLTLDFNPHANTTKTGPTVTKQITNAKERKAFGQVEAANEWKQVFNDPCTGDWKKQWFLDGEVGKVTTGPDGMTLTAGPEFKNDAHHMVLWTKQSFEGDLKIEYDYTRLDNENRCVTILYIQATGSGKGAFAKDITKWNELRKVPAMRTYFNHMNTYHISYAAFGNTGDSDHVLHPRPPLHAAPVRPQGHRPRTGLLLRHTVRHRRQASHHRHQEGSRPVHAGRESRRGGLLPHGQPEAAADHRGPHRPAPHVHAVGPL
jgi:hypothetical protein